MVESEAEFSAILEVLSRRKVDFIVVGGVCAVLLGAPIATFDLDIVYSRSEENLQRLSAALNELEAHYREHNNATQPTLTSLSQSGHHLLATKFGPLDVLGSIGIDDDYEKLVNRAEKIELDDNTKVMILSLEALISVKEKTARAKDNYMLEILRALKDDLA